MWQSSVLRRASSVARQEPFISLLFSLLFSVPCLSFSAETPILRGFSGFLDIFRPPLYRDLQGSLRVGSVAQSVARAIHGLNLPRD
jgi:hypothetical protein